MCVPKWGQQAWSDVGLFSRQTTSLSRAGSKFNAPCQRSDLYRSGCTRYADSPSWVSYTFSSLMFPCLIKINGLTPDKYICQHESAADHYKCFR